MSLFTNFGTLSQGGGLFTIGMIIPFHSSLGNIPDGWQICDGNNGTPDLTNKFVMGTTSEVEIGFTGGSSSKTLSNVPQHNHPLNADWSGNHRHGIQGWYNGNTNDGYFEYVVGTYINPAQDPPTYTEPAGAHNHTLGTIPNAGASSPADFNIIPKSIKLVYIMKVS